MLWAALSRAAQIHKTPASRPRSRVSHRGPGKTGGLLNCSFQKDFEGGRVPAFAERQRDHIASASCRSGSGAVLMLEGENKENT